MSTSSARSLPSGLLVDAAPTKSPVLMSERLFLTIPDTVKFGARAIVSTGPSRDFTVRVWPSSFSTVPRIRVGLAAGGAWASAGPTARSTRVAVIANRLIVQPPVRVVVYRNRNLHRWLDAVLLRRHAGRRQAAV